MRVEKMVFSSFSMIFSGMSGRVKLGHPVLGSYLSRELKRGSPETISTYMPGRVLSQYLLANGVSVPFSCVTWY